MKLLRGPSRLPPVPAHGAAVLALAVFLALPRSGGGQVVPDTIPPDSLPEMVTPDDSLAAQETPGDTINPRDTLPAVVLPAMARPIPVGWETGVWEWSRDEILGSRAITLAELVAQVPGVVRVRGGDYGMPRSASVFGSGGARLRVFRDGLEILPLEGSTPDLTRVPLGGLASVRVIRSAGELRIELESLLTEGGRAYSLIEAGTGDLNTNLFRGTFLHPRAFGGAVALALDRVDTQGPRGREEGAGWGGWIRYARPLRGSGSLVFDYSTMTSTRGQLYDPEKANRSDWSVRTRWNPLPGLVGDLFYGGSSLKTEEPDTFEFRPRDHTRYGAILGYESDWVRSRGRLEKLTGEGVPGTRAALDVDAGLGRFGGVAAEWSWEDWEERSLSRTRLRAWTTPLFGLSLFAETGSGEWGLPYLSPIVIPGDTATGEGEEPSPPDTLDSPVPGPRFTRHEGTRYGVRFGWRGLALGGARVEVETDSLFLMGLPMDRSGQTLPGGKRRGLEIWGRMPLYFQNLALEGSAQWWDQEEDVWKTDEDGEPTSEALPEEEMPWRYLPRRNYDARLAFHDTFLSTGNLEVWFDVGVKGRDPMVVPFLDEETLQNPSGPAPVMVPFQQSWFARLQIRVVTVRAFIMWENISVRRRNQDIPGRIFPATRSIYGVRWVMRN